MEGPIPTLSLNQSKFFSHSHDRAPQDPRPADQIKDLHWARRTTLYFSELPKSQVSLQLPMENANINHDSLRTRRDCQSQDLEPETREVPEYEEKFGFINESENKQLRAEIDEYSKDEREASLPQEIEYCGEAKETVNDLRARISFLENVVINGLQRELGSVSAEAEIAVAEAKAAKEELWQMKAGFQEMKQSCRDMEWGLKEEKAAMLERLERLTMKNQHLWKEARDGIFEREKEITTLKRELEESRAKNLEKEKKILELERGILKFPWPAAASAGTVVAAAMIFLTCSKQKRQ